MPAVVPLCSVLDFMCLVNGAAKLSYVQIQPKCLSYRFLFASHREKISISMCFSAVALSNLMESNRVFEVPCVARYGVITGLSLRLETK